MSYQLQIGLPDEGLRDAYLQESVLRLGVLQQVTLQENTGQPKAELTLQSNLQPRPMCAIVNFQQAAVNEACHNLNSGLSTGYADLDAILPDGGWPSNDLVEMITTQFGTTELQLVLPLMKTVIDQGKWVLWIAPPYIPYAPLLVSAGIDISRVNAIQPESTCEIALSSIESALNDNDCAMVIAWLDWLPNSVVRRIQRAAKLGNKLGVLFRQHDNKDSPATLRLQLKPYFEGVCVTALKR